MENAGDKAGLGRPSRKAGGARYSQSAGARLAGSKRRASVRKARTEAPALLAAAVPGILKQPQHLSGIYEPRICDHIRVQLEKLAPFRAAAVEPPAYRPQAVAGNNRAEVAADQERRGRIARLAFRSHDADRGHKCLGVGFGADRIDAGLIEA